MRTFLRPSPIFCLVFGAAAGGPTPAAWAQNDPVPLELRHHRRSILSASNRLEKGTFELQGIIERAPDEGLILALPLSQATRKRMARALGVSLNKVPDAVRRRVEVAPGGPSRVQIRRRLGRPVRAVLTRDRSGQTFLLAFYVPR